MREQERLENMEHTDSENDPVMPRKTRADRRAHRRRVVAGAMRKLSRLSSREKLRDYARRNADHLKVCSCWMCRNLRAREGMTIQERKALLRETDE
jgi:hypothetical protein